MYYLLFLVYLTLCCLVIPRLQFIKRSELTSKVIILLFLAKVIAGLTLGWVFDYYYSPGNDYWDLNAYGTEEYSLLINDPWQFATNLFRAHYPDKGSFFSSNDSFWNDLENNLIIKILAVFNIFSRGNYYINSLLFNFFGFFGHMALFRIFAQLYPGRRAASIIGCFLLPSALFFSSGLNKDNAVFTLLCLFCYLIFFLLKDGSSIRRAFFACTIFAGILLLRNYAAVALLPGLVGWFAASRFDIKKRFSFPLAFVGTLALVAGLAAMYPSFNPAAVIAQKQQDFFSLPIARSQIKTDTLATSVAGLMNNAPQAFNHGFLRPYVWEAKSLFTLAQAVELGVYLALFLGACVLSCVARRKTTIDPFVPFVIVSCSFILLLIGYIVPNTQSIVRYRSIYLPFLITPLLCYLQPFVAVKQIKI